MKNFIILIIQLCGYAFFLVAVLALVNYLFGFSLGFKGTEIPGEPLFIVAFLILGAVVAPLGWWLDKKVSV
jgi:hypothetical protein